MYVYVYLKAKNENCYAAWQEHWERLNPNSLHWREGTENLMGLLCQLDHARTSTKRDKGKSPGKGQRLSPSYLCREGDKSYLHFNLWKKKKKGKTKAQKQHHAKDCDHCSLLSARREKVKTPHSRRGRIVRLSLLSLSLSLLFSWLALFTLREHPLALASCGRRSIAGSAE